ncbi:MAG: CoB--CoM heterodisulfide reductase iron-sulfur subunit B family protein [Candidatus Bathyarchaeia archaeon]
MQSYLYFPGCSLRTVARDFDDSAQACARALGVELKEMQGWLCCGAVFSNVADNIMTNAGPNRILARARSEGDTLVTLCAGCHNVLRRANLQAGRNAIKQEQINEFNEEKYEGGLSVLHFLEILRDRVGFSAVRDAVKAPLQGLPVGAYYGCLLLRPFDEMKLDDPHRPSILEDLLVSIGCTPVDYPSRTECCGSYLGVGSPDAMALLSRNVVQSARSNGARMLAVSCPLCKYNLETSQKQDLGVSSDSQPLPVVYFTQLLGLALGAESESLRLDPLQVQAIHGGMHTTLENVSQT